MVTKSLKDNYDFDAQKCFINGPLVYLMRPKTMMQKVNKVNSYFSALGSAVKEMPGEKLSWRGRGRREREKEILYVTHTYTYTLYTHTCRSP